MSQTSNEHPLNDWREIEWDNNNNNNTFMFQRISVLLFRFNSVLLHNSFELDDRPEH